MTTDTATSPGAISAADSRRRRARGRGRRATINRNAPAPAKSAATRRRRRRCSRNGIDEASQEIDEGRHVSTLGTCSRTRRIAVHKSAIRTES